MEIETTISPQLEQLESENRKMRREIKHLKNAVIQEKLATTTALNHQKASTFIQRERERYLMLLLANSPSIILFLSNKNRIEFCTEYFIAKANYSKTTDILGLTLTEVISQFLDNDSHEKLLECIQKAMNTNNPIAFDIAFCFSKNGEIEDFAGLLVPMKDEEEHSNSIMLMLNDVTSLKRSREEALEASKAKSSFLSNMSHEIRTPMNAIIGMTAIGKQGKDLESKDRAFKKIENASTLLLGIINDILDISKIESGKMELSNIVFDFNKMIDRVMGVTTHKMQEKHQNFQIDIDSNIPKILFGDDQRLAQVITNVLSNSTKFTPDEGSISFNAKLLSIENDICTVQMYVKDSGIGMSKEEQSKLFTNFQQAEAGTSRKYGGSGLGLALSKRILEIMGGKIWVESEPGKGSKFIFTANFKIPSEKESENFIKENELLNSGGKNGQNIDFSGKVIMIADDIDINLEIMIALLEPTKAVIETAKNGNELIDAFSANPDRYDLIFMDVQMPELDGLEATKIIRALNTPKAKEIPIIAMTANVFKEDIEKCLDAGMNGHLGKPIIMDDIIKTLSLYLKPEK